MQGTRQRIHQEEEMFDPTCEKTKQVPGKYKKDGARRNEELLDIVKYDESLEGEMQSGRAADKAVKRIPIHQGFTKNVSNVDKLLNRLFIYIWMVLQAYPMEERRIGGSKNLTRNISIKKCKRR